MTETKLGIRKLLSIADFEEENIYGVVGRMEVLLDFFKSQPRYHSLVPFLETYYLVTKAVADKRVESKKYYQNPQALDHLDVYFASLYFEPLKVYLETGKTPKPWQTYFAYCKLEHGHPFVQMLLGINAHINSDLTASLIHTRYNYKKDFLRINKILQEVIPSVMKFLAFHEHDFLGLGGVIFKEFIGEEFHKIVVKWRSTSWKNARRIKIITPQHHRQLNSQTEQIGKDIIKIFDLSFKNLSHLVKQLNSLRIISK